MSLLTEAIYSDLPQLALMCFLSPTEEDTKKYPKLKPYDNYELAMHYYECLLGSE
jgi:hypothetical protein